MLRFFLLLIHEPNYTKHLNMNFASFILCALILTLQGCSQYIQDTGATMKEAFTGLEDTTVTLEKVRDLPYASIYARINHGHRLFLVLAFAETNPVTQSLRLKWVSSDGAMLVTENGRIVKTLNLPDYNLVEAHYPQRPTEKAAAWQSYYDWQPGYQFDQSVFVSSSLVKFEHLTSLLWQTKAAKIAENLTFSDGSQHQNFYWLNEQGLVVKSLQWLIPEKLMIEIEILKPYIG